MSQLKVSDVRRDVQDQPQMVMDSGRNASEPEPPPSPSKAPVSSPAAEEVPLLRIVCVLVGGFLIACCVGLMYLWGIILVYITSYFRQQGDSTLTKASAGIVLPLAFFGMACTTPFGTTIMGLLGQRGAVLVVGYLMALFIFVSSYMPNFGLFVLFYSILAGLCHGPLYIVPLAHGYKFLSTKAIVSGIVASGVGIGTLMFSLVLVNLIINPDNVSYGKSGYYDDGERQIAVAANVPIFLRYTALSIVVLISAGTALLVDASHIHPHADDQPHQGLNALSVHHHVEHEPHHPVAQNRGMSFAKVNELHLKITRAEYDLLRKDPEPIHALKKRSMIIASGHQLEREGGDIFEQQVDVKVSWQQLMKDRQRSKLRKQLLRSEEEQAKLLVHGDECVYFWNVFRTRIFWVMFGMMFLGANIGLFTSGNYKSYAHLNIEDDRVLTLAGSLGSVSNGVCRILFGMLLACLPFRVVYVFMMLLGIGVAATFQFTVSSDAGIIIYLILIYGVYAGNYTLFPTVGLKIFGKHIGAQVYAVLFMAFALTNFLQFIFQNTILQGVAGNRGYQIVYYVQAGMYGLSLLLYFTMFSENYDWTNLNYQYLMKVGPKEYLKRLEELNS